MECYEANGEPNLLYYSKETFFHLYYQVLMDTPYYENAIEYYDKMGIEHESNRRAL
jgi:hypothetical protein